MIKREIDPAWVADTLFYPDWTEPNPRRAERTRSSKMVTAMVIECYELSIGVMDLI